MNNLNDIAREVIDAADIVQIIGEYVSLERKGNDYKGLCPFHNDTNPSLSVSPGKKVFKCFSCNTAGNVIQFVQKIENIGFIAALRKVAAKAGLKINIRENPEEVRLNKYYRLMESAADAYAFFLKNTKEGEEALAYLRSRGIDDEIIKTFRIGLSGSDGRTIVRTHIDTGKALPLELREIGLIGNDGDRYFDLFRGRIMFPLTDFEGHIIGFSGRIYNTDGEAKYINSRENIIFRKSDVLYNYARSVNAIKALDRVFVFEGFMDVIAAARVGIENTVATMGTALTEEQVKLILKATSNVVLCYDGDEAGTVASRRAVKMFAGQNVAVKMVPLPAGTDPDDYLNRYGAEKTAELLREKSENAVDYFYRTEKEKLRRDDPNSITAFQKNVFELIDFFPNAALQSYLFGLLSKDLQIPQDVLRRDFRFVSKRNDSNAFVSNAFVSKRYVPAPEMFTENILLQTDVPPMDVVPVKPRLLCENRYQRAEKYLIYLSFLHREDCLKIKRELEIEEIVDKINRNILLRLYEYYRLSKKMNKEEFFACLNDLETERANAIINMIDIPINRDCLEEYIETVKKAKSADRFEKISARKEAGTFNTDMLLESIKCKKKTVRFKKTKERKDD